MAESFVSVRPVVESMEGRTLMSAAPVLSQFPPIILSKSYSSPSKSDPAPTPRPVKSAFPPPITAPVVVEEPAEPVQALPAEAPGGLKAIASRRRCIICVSWKSVAASAETTVVECSTDGETFSTMALLEPGQKKQAARKLDPDKTYTFRVYTLDADGKASAAAEVTASWDCKK